MRTIAGKRWFCTRPPHNYTERVSGWGGRTLYMIDQTERHWFRRGGMK